MRPPPQWIVRCRRLLVIGFIVVFAALAARAVTDVWLGRRLEAETARLEKQYERERKTWPRRMAPENRARLLDAAAALVTASSDATTTLFHGPQAPFTVTPDQARAIADENREAVQMALRASHLRLSNWDSNVRSPLDLRYLSTVLAMAARSDTDAGRPDAAIADVTAGFALAAAMSSEPGIMPLLGMDVAFTQADVLEDVLNRAEPSGVALASIAAAIAENLSAHPARAAIVGELDESLQSWPRVERGWFGFRMDSEGYPLRPVAWTRGVAWLFRPLIRFRALQSLRDKAWAVEAVSTPYGQRAGLGAPPAGAETGFIEVGDISTASSGHAAIAVALRRFRLDHGTHPDTLAELAPQYLKAVPLDPFTGHPHEYVRSGAGYILRAQLPERFLYSGKQEWVMAR